MSDTPTPDPDPMPVLQRALDALPDDRLDVVTRALARLALLPLWIIEHAVAVGESEARRFAPPQPVPSFPGDRVPPRSYRQPTVEDVVGNPEYKWPRGT